MKYKNLNCGKKIKRKGEWEYTSEFCNDGAGNGYVYKNFVAFYEPQRYKNQSEIVYIPEHGFPENKTNRAIESELISSYSRQALIDLTMNETLAGELLEELSWQSPEALWREWCEDSDKHQHWILAQYAYDEVYLPEQKCLEKIYREPVCFDEYLHNEWQDYGNRKESLEHLKAWNIITPEEVKAAMADFEKQEIMS